MAPYTIVCLGSRATATSGTQSPNLCKRLAKVNNDSDRQSRATRGPHEGRDTGAVARVYTSLSRPAGREDG